MEENAEVEVDEEGGEVELKGEEKSKIEDEEENAKGGEEDKVKEEEEEGKKEGDQKKKKKMTKLQGQQYHYNMNKEQQKVRPAKQSLTRVSSV